MSKIEVPTQEELEELEGTVAVKPEAEIVAEDTGIAELGGDTDPDLLPEWSQQAIPAGLKIPLGRTLTIMRFRAEWTDTVHKGDRTCVLWNLSVGDGKIANMRAGDNGFNAMMERAKQTVRAVDGQIIDWTGKRPGANLNTWWDEIGEKCRNLIVAAYTKSHSLSIVERTDFFAHCVVARTNLPTG